MTYFDSSQALADTLTRYVRLYNHQIPQKALGHLSPVQALKQWQQKDPKRFKKKVCNLTGLDSRYEPAGGHLPAQLSTPGNHKPQDVQRVSAAIQRAQRKVWHHCEAIFR